MLFEATLDEEYWGEAMMTAVYLLNRSYTSVVKGKTPFELWYGRKPSLKHLRVFGCKAYAYEANDSKRTKLGVRGNPCIFTGYQENLYGYRLIDAKTHRATTSRHVVFVENDFSVFEEISLPSVGATDSQREDDVVFPRPSGRIEEAVAVEDYSTDESDYQTLSTHSSITDSDDEESESPNERATPPRRSTRHRTPTIADSARYAAQFAHASAESGMALMGLNDEPLHFKEALKSADVSKWNEAMNDEFTSLTRNETWTLVPRPPHCNVVGTRWVYKRKVGRNGQLDRYRARLVAKGFTQKYGVDFEETYAPVVKFTSIRMLVAFGLARGMVTGQMDVVTAFLQSNLTEEVYMAQPEGFVSKEHPDWVCKLKKAIYGLKQSAREWYGTSDEHLISQGFKRNDADQCVYVKTDKSGNLSIVAIYVDDLMIFCDQERDLIEIKSMFSKRFAMTDLGELNWILGVDIQRDKVQPIVRLSQKVYIEKMLGRFGMTDFVPTSVPVVLQEENPNDEPAGDVPYQAAVGSLMYAMVATRPDIAMAVGYVSRYSHAPLKSHWMAVLRIFKYLKGTLNYCLEYVKTGNLSEDLTLRVYSDSDYAGCKQTSRSTSGYCAMIGSNTVSWSSTRQKLVTMSSAEAEYVALTDAAKEVVWARRFLKNLGIVFKRPTEVLEDNQSAIALVKSAGSHKRTKHIAVRYHWIRELQSKNIVDVKYLPTGEMIADTFTKGLGNLLFEKHRSALGVRCVHIPKESGSVRN